VVVATSNKQEAGCCALKSKKAGASYIEISTDAVIITKIPQFFNFVLSIVLAAYLYFIKQHHLCYMANRFVHLFFRYFARPSLFFQTSGISTGGCTSLAFVIGV
jgi:hypothetical protein